MDKNSLYIYKGRERLRCGYTTGTCAAAAAKAAALMLLTGEKVSAVDITVPKGIRLRLEVTACEIAEGFAKCAVVKDSGDDPDVTNGITIFAKVSLKAEGVSIDGGEGIGRVTKAGLDQPVGSAAINSVPRKMIELALFEAAESLDYRGGFEVMISAPRGEEIAKKTFNPRLGIVGGISIIGTTGIVEPMSNSALIETIRAEASMHRAGGEKDLLLTIGNYSEQFLRLNAPRLESRGVMCSNFIGEAIDIGLSLGFEKILLVGHIGKLCKLSVGIMNTHSHTADGRMESFIACAALAGVDTKIIRALDGCATTDAAIDLLSDKGVLDITMNVLIGRIERYLKDRVRSEAEIGAVVFSYKSELLLKTTGAEGILRAICEEENKNG